MLHVHVGDQLFSTACMGEGTCWVAQLFGTEAVDLAGPRSPAWLLGPADVGRTRQLSWHQSAVCSGLMYDHHSV